MARRVTPGMRARRALSVDLLAAGALAALVLSLAAGLGVAAAIALPVLVLGLAWVCVERLARRLRSRRAERRRDPTELSSEL